MFDQTKVLYATVEYHLPFVLEVEDSLSKSYKDSGYIIDINGLSARMQTQHIHVNNTYAAGASLEIDRYGQISHTVVKIIFDSQFINSDLVDKSLLVVQHNKVFEQSLLFLNKFIKSYRIVSDHFFINPITRNDILNYEYHLIDSAGEISTSLVVCTQKIEFLGGKNKIIDDQANEYLKKLLVDDDDHFFEDLDLSVYENYDKGYYNIALIQCAILFEYFVYSTLKNRFHWSNNKSDRYKKCEVCGGIIGIYEICTRGLKSDLGIDFGSTIEFKNFNENVIKIRNKIVHGNSLKPISEVECVAALKAYKSAYKKLTDLFNGIIQNKKS